MVVCDSLCNFMFRSLSILSERYSAHTICKNSTQLAEDFRPPESELWDYAFYLLNHSTNKSYINTIQLLAMTILDILKSYFNKFACPERHCSYIQFLNGCLQGVQKMTDQKLLRVRSLLLRTYIHLIDGHTGSHCCILQSLHEGQLEKCDYAGICDKGWNAIRGPFRVINRYSLPSTPLSNW